MHTTLKNVELLKHFKISKTAPTCFGLQGNHHQGATVTVTRCVHQLENKVLDIVDARCNREVL